MAISDYLRDCAYQVLEAANADEALTILTDGNTKVDVVFADVELPGELDGFGLARWVRANKKSIKVLLAGTVAKAADVAADLCEDGPMMSKPYDKQIVVDRIKRLLAAAEDKEI
jgi:CheY-like chemotaxis protein